MWPVTNSCRLPATTAYYIGDIAAMALGNGDPRVRVCARGLQAYMTDGRGRRGKDGRIPHMLEVLAISCHGILIM